MNKDKLFTDFPPVSTEAWESAIKTDLRGADYDKKLIWKSQEGFPVRPYYRAEDLANKSIFQSSPGKFPYLRGSKSSGNNWEVSFSIMVADPVEANKNALYFLNRGVSSLKFSFIQGFFKTMELNRKLISSLLQNISIDCIELNFDAGAHSFKLLELLLDYSRANGIAPENLRGFVSYDPFNHLVRTGDFYQNETEDFLICRDITRHCITSLPNFKTISVNTSIFGDAGALITQEIAFALAAGSEYLDYLCKKDLSVDEILHKIHFIFSSGPDFFAEISRLRAFRFLWSKLAETWNPGNKESANTYIHSVTGNWNQSIYDAHVNLLRNTTSAMSAVLGGADSVEVKAFDSVFRESNDFSDRLAINTQLILKEESWLDKVADPAAGSYYIETLTESIIQKSWSIFLEIEKNGGYLACLKKSLVQEMVETTANSRINNVSTRKEIILGTNEFPVYNEQAISIVEKEIFVSHSDSGHNTIRKLNLLRASSELEILRLKSEKQNPRPKAFILTIGNPIMRLARANFASNFFACGGFEIADNTGFHSTESGVEAAIKSRPDIVVICSSDEEYAGLVPEIDRLLRLKYAGKSKKPILVVAGAPPCMEELKAKGIDHFIHIRSNLAQTLKAYQSELGIGD